MNDKLIVTSGLSKIYRSGKKEVAAINDINISISAGRFTAIVGPSGAGKSTLLHMLGGLDMPTSGKVLLSGVDIYALPDKERARMRNRQVGFIFQFYHLLPEFTALENVAMPLLISGKYSRGSGSSPAEKAAEMLKAVGLERRMDHRPSELSGGESQRVAIARALINTPEVLLCDEPTGNLDSATSGSIYELLFGLKRKYDMALVIVSHDERLAKEAEDTVNIKDGRTSDWGSVQTP